MSLATPLARCVVLTTDASPISGQISELLLAINESATGQKTVTISRFDVEDVFDGGTAEHDKEIFDSLVQHLATAQLAIIDMDTTARAEYLVGIRHALSNNPMIALSSIAAEKTVVSSRFVAKPQSVINVRDSSWKSQALEIAKTIHQAPGRGYQNDVQAAKTVQITPIDPPFRRACVDKQTWRWPGTGPTIEIWKGGIATADRYDVWVNSENTYMEMARFWERSISAQIRKLGAVRRGPLRQNRRKDALGLKLAEKLGSQANVAIGTVILTETDPASDLYVKNGVSYVAHVATAEPDEYNGGFKAAGKVELCITNAFREFIKEKRHLKAMNMNSILFPLFGTGDGGASASLVAHQLVYSLRKVLEREQNVFKSEDINAINRIGLIAYTESHFAMFQNELKSAGFSADPILEV